jgi:hypothetical protein
MALAVIEQQLYLLYDTGRHPGKLNRERGLNQREHAPD